LTHLRPSGFSDKLLDEKGNVVLRSRWGWREHTVKVGDRTFYERFSREGNVTKFIVPPRSSAVVIVSGSLEDETLAAELLDPAWKPFSFSIIGRKPYVTMSCIGESGNPEAYFRFTSSRLRVAMVGSRRVEIVSNLTGDSELLMLNQAAGRFRERYYSSHGGS
jgi:hypothetical protein